MLHTKYKLSRGLQGDASYQILRFYALWFQTRRYFHFSLHIKIVSEYDQEIPQSQTADNPKAP